MALIENSVGTSYLMTDFDQHCYEGHRRVHPLHAGQQTDTAVRPVKVPATTGKCWPTTRS